MSVGDRAARFLLEPLDAQHDREVFTCGNEALDRYLKTQATQDIRRRVANCFVAVERETKTIGGFYTLASAGIPTQDLPAAVSKRLPRYPSTPASRIGRLAVALAFRGTGLGGGLLADALHRAAQSLAAAFAILVDAKDDAAVAFYRHHGFIALTDRPRTLFLPVATVREM